MRLRGLDGSIGVEVTDLDLTGATGLGPDCSAADIEGLRAALDSRHLVLVRIDTPA